MDELKLTLTSPIVKPLITKILASVLYKQLGYKINIQLNDIRVTVDKDVAKVHIDADADITSSDLVKLVKELAKIES